MGAAVRRWVGGSLGVVLATLAILVVAGCGGGTNPSLPAPPTATVLPSTPPGPPRTGGPDLGLVTVPNVVGMDLQRAQEILFPPLRSMSVDATGQGRDQLIDSNWVVVRQDPAAGSKVIPLKEVTLYVVKKGETAG